MELILPHGCLAVFVDDTGHEALVKGHPVYGLGGCAVMATDLDRLINTPWREVRRKVTGSPDRPMHAASFARNASAEQIELVAEFFRSYSFARLGATISIETILANEIGLVQTIARVLGNRIADIAKWAAFKEMAVIFESSERANSLIEAAFCDFQLQENGQSIPVECYFMPKSAGAPPLEVADFVMHAVGRQARRRIQGRQGFALDFEAVFHAVDRKLVSFLEVSAAQKNAS